MYKTIRELKSFKIIPLFLRSMNNAAQNTPIEISMRTKLTDSLKPSYLDVVNESYMHNVPKGSETHFKVIIVTEKFYDLPLIERHRMVNELLQAELQQSVHALSIVAKTPEQWETSNKTIAPSPACKGGFGR